MPLFKKKDKNVAKRERAEADLILLAKGRRPLFRRQKKNFIAEFEKALTSYPDIYRLRDKKRRNLKEIAQKKVNNRVVEDIDKAISANPDAVYYFKDKKTPEFFADFQLAINEFRYDAAKYIYSAFRPVSDTEILVKMQNGQGKTLLMLAAENGDFKTVESIIKIVNESTKRDFPATDKQGNTALHYAANLETAKLLASNEIYTRNNNGEAPAQYIARTIPPKSDVVNFLIEEEGDPRPSLTDKIHIALVRRLFVNKRNNKIANKYQFEEGSGELKLFNEVMKLLLDSNLKTNQELLDQIDIVRAKYAGLEPANVKLILADISQITNEVREEEKLNPRFDEQPTEVQSAARNVNDFLGISPKVGGKGAQGFIGIEKIKKPNSDPDAVKDYSNPWLIKDYEGDIGEDFAGEFARYLLGEDNFYQIDTIAAEGKKMVAGKYILNAEHLDKDFTTPPENLVESLTVALLLGHSDVKDENALVQYDKKRKKPIFKIIDWDVWGNNETFVVQGMVDDLAAAIEKGNIKEVKDILSFRKLLNRRDEVHKVVAEGKGGCKTNPHLKMWLEQSGATYTDAEILAAESASLDKLQISSRESDIIRRALDKMKPKEIFSAVADIAAKDYKPIINIGTSALVLYSSDQQRIDTCRFYQDRLIDKMDNLKKVTRKYNTKKPDSDIAVIYDNEKKDPVKPKELIQYYAGEIIFAQEVAKGKKGLISFRPRLADFHRETYKEAIQRIKPGEEIDYDLINIIFPSDYYQGKSFYPSPVIQDKIKFQKIFHQQDPKLKESVHNNLTLAIEQVSKYLESAEFDNPAITKLIARASNCLEMFQHPKREGLIAFLISSCKTITPPEQPIEEKKLITSPKPPKVTPPAPTPKIISGPKPTIKPKPKYSVSLKSLNRCNKVTEGDLEKFSLSDATKESWRTIIREGKHLYNVNFSKKSVSNSALNDFSFLGSEEMNEEQVYQKAVAATNKSIDNLFTKESDKFRKVINNILTIDDEDSPIFELSKVLKDLKDDDVECKKAVLIFIVNSAKDNNGFKNSELEDLPNNLFKDLKYISAKMQEYNKEQGLYAPLVDGIRPVGMRSKRMMTKSIEHYPNLITTASKPSARVNDVGRG